MKKLLFSIFAFAALQQGTAQTWSLDKSHARLGFVVTHLMISDVDGQFKVIDGKFTSSKPDFSDAKIEFTADAASVNTNQDDRDKHLRSADFFEVEKFPTISFKSMTFEKVKDKEYKLTGNLTMHGVTRFVSLPVTLKGTTVHPYSKKDVVAFQVKGSIKRSDFNLGGSTPTSVVADEVALIANVEFLKD